MILVLKKRSAEMDFKFLTYRNSKTRLPFIPRDQYVNRIFYSKIILWEAGISRLSRSSNRGTQMRSMEGKHADFLIFCRSLFLFFSLETTLHPWLLHHHFLGLNTAAAFNLQLIKRLTSNSLFFGWSAFSRLTVIQNLSGLDTYLHLLRCPATPNWQLS